MRLLLAAISFVLWFSFCEVFNRSPRTVNVSLGRSLQLLVSEPLIAAAGTDGKHFLQPGHVARSLAQQHVLSSGSTEHACRFVLPDVEAALFVTDPCSGVCLCRPRRLCCPFRPCLPSLTCEVRPARLAGRRTALRGLQLPGAFGLLDPFGKLANGDCQALPHAILREVGGALCASLDYSFPRTFLEDSCSRVGIHVTSQDGGHA